MNKTELISAIAAEASLTKVDAGRAVDSFINVITNALKTGDSVSLVGFGAFKTSARAERTGKNPKTGEALKIAATVVPKFSPGAALKEAVASNAKSKGKK